MCLPIIAVDLPTILTVVAGVYTAVNQYQAGKADNKYYQYLAGQSEEEAKAKKEYAKKQGEAIVSTAEKQSHLIQESAGEDFKTLKKDEAQVLSSQRAALAANGIDLSSVTAQDIASDTLSKAKLDEINIRYNADVKSWETKEEANYKKWALESGADIDAWNLRTRADQYRYAGKSALQTGKTQAFGTLLSTATSVASKWSPSGSLATPGAGGYGLNTPTGTRNMGNWSYVPKWGN